MAATPYLSVHAIQKHYGPVAALPGVDLDVERGAFVALLGPSGCGKSTLLRILAGLLDAEGGAIRLDGQDITGLPAWRRDIGLVFQNYALFPHMSVRENVRFGLDMRRITGAEAEARVDEALALVGLDKHLSRRPSELSGGQQQRVAIARAVAIRPRLLLLDEPLSNLDAVLRTKVRLELRELHDRAGRGAFDGRPGRRDAGRAHPAIRHAAGALRRAGDGLRRRFHRQSGGQPAAALRRRAGRLAAGRRQPLDAAGDIGTRFSRCRRPGRLPDGASA